MQSSHDGHSQFTQKSQNMPAHGSTENAESMLQADHVDIVDIQEVRRTEIGRKVLFFNLEVHTSGYVSLRNVVH